ncbi:MAG: ribose-phosphate pyrophosphokinase [Blastocatellia bacterium]|nr:ribose-phosphate pyrophosphokinase [Blastocatellia bacterium]MCS7156717.1 ribose-phosphate pyrophosphokinase [Blastocatellia bacterium]MCX7751541.1 ribose-phosphate pyrophosphokinase [Blastocatellia bacterium]
MNGMKIFSGNSNRALAEEICQYLKVPLGNAFLGRFSDGEIQFQILENVRGADVFVIQSTCPPVDSNLMELLIMLDAFRRASAQRITAVIPYFGYARQDRKDKPRVPISAKLVADLLTTAGASRILTMDLHAGQIQGFFSIPVDHLFAAPVLVEYFRRKGIPDLVVVSPDAGGVERARAYAKRLDAELAIIDKRRERANVAEVLHIIGEVKGRTALIVDDMIDTAGTLTEVTEALLEGGAREVYACCTHAIFSGPAIERIERAPLREVVVTNTIPLSPRGQQVSKITYLSVAPLLGEAIRSIHEETSVSRLFI